MPGDRERCDFEPRVAVEQFLPEAFPLRGDRRENPRNVLEGEKEFLRLRIYVHAGRLYFQVLQSKLKGGEKFPPVGLRGDPGRNLGIEFLA